MKIQSKSLKSLNRFFLFFLLFLTALTQISCSNEDLENIPDLSVHAQEADHFILNTITRIAESWESAWMECRLALQHIGDQPVYLQRDLEAKAAIAAENLIDQTVDSLEKQADQTKQQIYDAAQDLIDEQRKSVDEQLEQMKDSWQDSREDIDGKIDAAAEQMMEK